MDEPHPKELFQCQFDCSLTLPKGFTTLGHRTKRMRKSITSGLQENTIVDVMSHLALEEGSSCSKDMSHIGFSAPLVINGCTHDGKADPRTHLKDNLCTLQVVKKRRVLKSAHPNSPVLNVKMLLSTGLMEGLPIKYIFYDHEIEINGVIKDLGYLCGCSSCNYTRVVSAAEFGKHSGVTSGDHNRHILLNSGKSLSKVVKELKKHRLGSLESVIEKTVGCKPNWDQYNSWKESFAGGNHGSKSRNHGANKITTPNFEDHETFHNIFSGRKCSVCGEGGNLVYCKRCPRAYHIVCQGLDYAKQDEWYCSNCSDKINSRIPFKDGKTNVRVHRALKTPAMFRGWCSLCRGSHFSVGTFNDETILICSQCEKEFHIGCLRKSGTCDLKVIPASDWFCCSSCSLIYYALQKILASTKAKVVPEMSAQQLARKLQQNGSVTGAGYSAKWQLLSGKIQSSKNKTMLSKVHTLFHGSFNPMIDESGLDLLPAMIHGVSTGGHDLEHMYCAILKIRSKVVSAMIIRVMGKEIAELPLAATTPEMRGMGLFACLLSCIEQFLHNLNVEYLILAVAEDGEEIWVKKFGFRRMTDQRCNDLMMTYPLLMFEGANLLEKPLF